MQRYEDTTTRYLSTRLIVDSHGSFPRFLELITLYSVGRGLS